MPPLSWMAPQVCALTFLVSLLSGFVPLLNLELYLISLSALWPELSPVGIVLAAAAGQMTAKGILYRGGRGLLSLNFGRYDARIRRATPRLAGGDRRAASVVFASALTGIPPFYVTSVAAGFVRFPGRVFLGVGLTGRILRFSAVFLLPRLF